MGLSDVWKKNKLMPPPESDEHPVEEADFAPYHEEHQQLEVGELVGDRYQLETVIHEGGMGKIFLAQHRQHNTKVVIKTIRLDMMEDGSKQLYNRFRREARGMSLLAHPNIVRILGCDLSDPLHAYIVMEYVPGETLWDFMERFPKGVMIHVFLQIITQLCSAMDLVHRKDIIHRDLKPNNIMISGQGTQYHIKLLDLGLIMFARQFSVTSQMRLTRAGQVIGTPAYMSPEQCRGEEVTHLSDIYCMGLLAWELLVGQPAFEGKLPAELFAKQLKVTPKPVHLLRDDVPLKISNAIQTALEKDPAKRPQSSREFFQAIRF